MARLADDGQVDTALPPVDRQTEEWLAAPEVATEMRSQVAEVAVRRQGLPLVGQVGPSHAGPRRLALDALKA